MFRRFWNFIFSENIIPIVCILGVLGTMGFIAYMGATVNVRACEHAKQFAKHEVRGDQFGCYIKDDSGKWSVIKDPAHFLE